MSLHRRESAVTLRHCCHYRHISLPFRLIHRCNSDEVSCGNTNSIIIVVVLMIDRLMAPSLLVSPSSIGRSVGKTSIPEPSQISKHSSSPRDRKKRWMHVLLISIITNFVRFATTRVVLLSTDLGIMPEEIFEPCVCVWVWAPSCHHHLPSACTTFSRRSFFCATKSMHV
jgi:hypothetical protein